MLLEPQLSVTLFQVDGWDDARYAAWSTSRARAGLALVLPTTWHGERCYRVCMVNPLTTPEMLAEILDDIDRLRRLVAAGEPRRARRRRP